MESKNIQFDKKEISEMINAMLHMSNVEIDDVVKLFISLAFEAPELFQQLKSGAEKAKEQNRVRRGRAMIKNVKWAY